MKFQRNALGIAVLSAVTAILVACGGGGLGGSVGQPSSQAADGPTAERLTASQGADRLVSSTSSAPIPGYYSTKTPYTPAQTSFSAPPSGFKPVFTQIVARHGSRGLSSPKYDLAMYNVWLKAQADGALTPLGQSLGADLMKVTKANALLGYGVPGIASPGYGNISAAGTEEHKLMAARMRARMSGLFSAAAATAGTATPRRINVISSGVDRAVDSSEAFIASLADTAALQSLVYKPPAPAPYPQGGTPVLQPVGTDRFQLYFHKLAPETDLVTNPTDPRYSTYNYSQTYQAWENNPVLEAKLAEVIALPEAKMHARDLLLRLFTAEFVDKIENGTYQFANTGSYTFTSDDGLFTTTITGNGKTKVQSVVDAALMLYNTYIILPGMRYELNNLDFTKYFTTTQLSFFGYMADAEEFYKQGPSYESSNGVAKEMATHLLNEFFREVQNVASGNISTAATLRFAHAETLIPFTSKVDVEDADDVDDDKIYSYSNNPWRGAKIAPMAANIQWDVFKNSSGKILVRQLHNEKEIKFKDSCSSAVYSGKFYDFTKLKACYGWAP